MTAPKTKPKQPRSKASPSSRKSAKRSEPRSATAEGSDTTPDIGPRLRELRSALNLSLDKLAKMAGVSRAMLGQIELGQSVPTIKTVWRISRALQVPFSSLLGPEPSAATVILPAGKAKVLQSADGSFSSRALFPLGSPRSVEFYELRLKGHSAENAEAHAPGTTENLIVASGKVEIELADQTLVLQTGDAIVFVADRPHAYVNRYDKDAVMYLVMTYADRQR